MRIVYISSLRDRRLIGKSKLGFRKKRSVLPTEILIGEIVEELVY